MFNTIYISSLETFKNSSFYYFKIEFIHVLYYCIWNHAEQMTALTRLKKLPFDLDPIIKTAHNKKARILPQWVSSCYFWRENECFVTWLVLSFTELAWFWQPSTFVFCWLWWWDEAQDRMTSAVGICRRRAKAQVASIKKETLHSLNVFSLTGYKAKSLQRYFKVKKIVWCCKVSRVGWQNLYNRIILILVCSDGWWYR